MSRRFAFVLVLCMFFVAPLLAQTASTSDLVYTTLPQPCRIIDTRNAGGRLTSVRSFKVAGTTGFEAQGGTSGGCGIPAGPAVAALINFVAVDPSGIGNIRASAWPNPVPSTGSIINYQQLTPSLNTANGLVFPICDSSASSCATGYDITVQPNGAAIDLVADVLGYYTKPGPVVSISIVPPAPSLMFTTLPQPCRIIDTRVAGGILLPGAPRNFKVAGTAGFDAQGGAVGGCGVPAGATVAMINFTAVDPLGPGNLKGAAFPNPIPVTGSIINYAQLVPPLNIANGLPFPICDPAVWTCDSDITLMPNVAGAHVVADVIGYFFATAQPSNPIPITQRDLMYTTFQQPCRIIDTRAAGGPLLPAVPRHFKVVGTTGFETQGGNPGGCGVPNGATVAMVNFVAVDPQGPGNVKGAAFPNPIPLTGSVINYQMLAPSLNLANGLLFPVCDSAQTTCAYDITLQANASAVSIVADVIGYATSHLPDPTAIYVSTNDASALDDDTCGIGPAGTGTGNHPCVTIGKGLLRAAAEARVRVNVAEGTYGEMVQLVSGVSLYGGYDAVTWQRNPATNQVTIGSAVKLMAGSNVANVVVDGFTFTALGGGASQSSVVITLQNAASVQISHNIIHAGKGGNGNAGANGAPPPGAAPNGAAGDAGTSGGSGGGYGAPYNGEPTAEFGGAGGRGGYDSGHGEYGSEGSGSAAAGAGGLDDACFGGGFAGSGGDNGANGTAGSHGASGIVVLGGLWPDGIFQPAAGSSGSTGTNGKGGSGGGGGGGGRADIFCLADRGGGGGAGGQGGIGGKPGAGGLGGGASAAIAVFNSTNVSVAENSIQTAGGGDGGAAGNGALGQSGGSGGPGGYGPDDAGSGGAGGPGGTGGTGGSGGGGGGGPSIGIVYDAASAPTLVNTGNLFSTGAGGAAGTCSQPGCHPGAAGSSYDVRQLP